MRLTLFLGLALLGGLAAGCGTTHQAPASAPTPVASTVAHPPAAHIAFLAPAQGASVGSTVVARVRLTGTGRVQFILDGGRPRIVGGRPQAADALAFRLRHLRPGAHLLSAQLLPAGRAAAVSATVRFRVRPRPVAAKRPAAVPAAGMAPAAPASGSSQGASAGSGSSAASASHAAAPAASTRHVPTPSAPAPRPAVPAPRPAVPAPPPPAAAAPPAAHQSPPSAGSPNAGGGIPQGGGGDGDADNSGGPSDGDGNI